MHLDQYFTNKSKNFWEHATEASGEMEKDNSSEWNKCNRCWNKTSIFLLKINHIFCKNG